MPNASVMIIENAGIGYAFQQPPRFKGMTVKRMLSLAAGKELTEVTHEMDAYLGI